MRTDLTSFRTDESLYKTWDQILQQLLHGYVVNQHADD